MLRTLQTARGTLILALVLTAVLTLEASARPARRGGSRHRQQASPGFELVLEGGMALPAGNQSDDLWITPEGLDAGTGYELGLRFRQFVAPGFAIAPAFHYVEFGGASGVGDFAEGDGLGYDVQTSLMRYGVDCQVFPAAGNRAGVQPYFSAGVALIHNRYRDELQFYGPYDTSVNTPSLGLGLGMKARNFEMSAAYNFNRFSTDTIAAGPTDLDYNWDYLTVRFGLAFGGR